MYVFWYLYYDIYIIAPICLSVTRVTIVIERPQIQQPFNIPIYIKQDIIVILSILELIVTGLLISYN